MPKAAIAKVAAFAAVVFTLLIGSALPAVASTGRATVADAQPWHYWISFVILFSAGLTVVIALPVQYYKRVYRLKHPKR